MQFTWARTGATHIREFLLVIRREAKHAQLISLSSLKPLSRMLIARALILLSLSRARCSSFLPGVLLELRHLGLELRDLEVARVDVGEVLQLANLLEVRVAGFELLRLGVSVAD